MKRRQGDVLFIKISSIPEGAKKLNHLVLAEGEVTGHKHQVIDGEAELYEGRIDQSVLENLPKSMREHFTIGQNVLFLRAISESVVVGHEEHKQQTLEKGDHLIPIQREYRPGGWDRVSD